MKLIDYLKQPSTWKGIVAVVTALGLVLSQEQKEAIIAAGLSVVGLIDVFTNEKQKKNDN